MASKKSGQPGGAPEPEGFAVISAVTGAIVVSGLASLDAARSEADRLNEEASRQGIRHAGAAMSYEARPRAGLLLP